MAKKTTTNVDEALTQVREFLELEDEDDDEPYKIEVLTATDTQFEVKVTDGVVGRAREVSYLMTGINKIVEKLGFTTVTKMLAEVGIFHLVMGIEPPEIKYPLGRQDVEKLVNEAIRFGWEQSGEGYNSEVNPAEDLTRLFKEFKKENKL